MSEKTEMLALAKLFFDALEKKNIEAIIRCCAPQLTLKHGTDGRVHSVDQVISRLVWLTSELPDGQYETVRRLTLYDGFFQQYRFSGRFADGEILVLHGCVRCWVDQGRIYRIDEWLLPHESVSDTACDGISHQL